VLNRIYKISRKAAKEERKIMKPPIISVVMNAYNKENYIGATIESILNQTFENFEFIIVNDGCTDKTADVIALYKDPRIRVFHQKQRIFRGKGKIYRSY